MKMTKNELKKMISNCVKNVIAQNESSPNQIENINLETYDENSRDLRKIGLEKYRVSLFYELSIWDYVWAKDKDDALDKVRLIHQKDLDAIEKMDSVRLCNAYCGGICPDDDAYPDTEDE